MRAHLLIAVLGLVACSTKEASEPAESVGAAIERAAEDAGAAVEATTTPFALALAEAVAIEALPEPAPPPRDQHVPGFTKASALITRWEVSGRKRYERELQGLICPPGASGPTGGIGYDFGHQTRAEIRRVWAFHPDVEVMAAASGVQGPAKCRAFINGPGREVRISWDEALRVFEGSTLPKYCRMAARALPGLERQTDGHWSGLCSTGYRRGWSMEGERMREKRVIRDQCVPPGNANCSAEQVEAMCRLWAGKPGGKGQCNRSADEARVIRSTS